LNIIFDLDGTLIDSKPRLYRLFQYLVPSSQLSYEEYWKLKQNKISHQTILTSQMGYKDQEITKFMSDWMKLIETPEFLKLDAAFPGMRSTLSRLKESATLHVCTARQFREPVLEQLESIGLLPFISQTLVTLQKYSKETLIDQHVEGRSSDDWILGDTGKDIQIGKLLGMRTCAVLSGFLNRKSLLDYSPDLIIDSANDFSP
jgi:phosphoglycolate phosphatase